MSLRINLNKLTDEKRNKIADELTFKKVDEKKGGFMPTMCQAPAPDIYAFDVDGEDLIVPFNYGVEDLGIERRTMDDCVSMGKDAKFGGTLRDIQKEVRKECVNLLNSRGSAVLSLHVGGGKTISAINIACKIGMKTLVIVNRLILMDQWEEAIKKFAPGAKVWQAKPASSVKKPKKGEVVITKDEADFIIVNAVNIPKFDFSEISFVIVDELHLIITEVMSAGLRRLNPRFMLGLSATPYRVDGLDGMINCYFGADRITRELNREHTVYRIFTKFSPEFTMNKMGGCDWNSVLNSQAYNNSRNQWIVDIVNGYPERTFLLMVKRVEQGRMLCRLLENQGITYDSLLGKEKYVPTDKRVLVATTGKASVGFDAPKLDTMILCADMGGDFYVQAIGRIMRKQDGNEPLVFDLVDNHPSLKRHWQDRGKVYRKHGGQVIDFFSRHKNFFSCEIKPNDD